MSFDLAVWHSTRAPTLEEAESIYATLCEEAPLSDRTGVVDGPGIKAFLSELDACFPNLDTLPEDVLDESPWASGFEASDRHVLLNFRWGEVSDAAIAKTVELAGRHGLVLFDPQGPEVHLPASLRPVVPRWQFWRR